MKKKGVPTSSVIFEINGQLIIAISCPHLQTHSSPLLFIPRVLALHRGSNSGGSSSSNNNGTGGLGIPAHLTLSFSAGPHWGAATLPQPHTVRSLDRALEEAGSSGILCLSGRKLRDFPGSGYDLSDTTQAGGGRGGGRCVGLRWGEGGAERSGASHRCGAWPIAALLPGGHPRAVRA